MEKCKEQSAKRGREIGGERREKSERGGLRWRQTRETKRLCKKAKDGDRREGEEESIVLQK